MRFTGSVEPIGPVEIASFGDWIAAIPFEAWPQQHPAPDGSLRPAMVTDQYWHGFGIKAFGLIRQLDLEFQAFQPMLSVVMPGQEIPPHKDEQPEAWCYRVHVPILSNYRAVFRCGGQDHVLLAGIAYKVNTLAEHAVYNRGNSPRVHFMFDVREP